MNERTEAQKKDNPADKLLFWSFCGLFFFIPVAKSPSIIMGLISLGIWIFSGMFIKKRRLLFKQKHLLPVVMLMVMICAGLIYADNFDYELRFVNSSYYWLYSFAIVSIHFAVFKPELLIKAYLWGLSFTSVLAIMQYAGLVPVRHHGAPHGLLGSYDHQSLSLFLVFGLLVLSFYFKKEVKMKRMFFILFVMAVYFIALSVVIIGRTGYLAFIISCPLMVYNLIGKKHLIKIIAVSTLLMIIFLMSPTVQQRVGAMMDDLNLYSEGIPNTPLGHRFLMWKASTDLFLKSPLIGMGSSGFKSVWEKNKPTFEADNYNTLNYNTPNYNTPHNTFFHLISSFGVFGLFFISWFFIILIKSGWQNKDNILGFSVLSFTYVFFIGSLTNTMITSSVMTAWVSAFVGLQAALKKK